MAKMAKAKKRKTVRKGGGIADRCRPLRQNVERLEAMIDKVRDDLSEPDIPRDLRRRLEQLLARLIAQLRQARALLRQCEAIPQG
jgi:hypothetical protein